MQHAALVLSLEKSALQSIKTQLLLLQKKNPTDHNHAAVDNIPFSQNTNPSHESALPPNKEAEPDLYDNELTAIKFEHFALTLLNHMNNMTKLGEKRTFNYHQLYTQTTSFYLQMASIIAVFDSVDIDSRGVIAFNDFVDFCLRLGRLLLKPSIKSTFSTYLQYEGSKGSLFPSHKMRYFPTLNALFVLDTETPRVRVYKKDGKFLTRVNPITEAKRLIRHQGIQKTTYYEKSNYEKEFSNMKSTERDFDESKGQILDCCYIDSLKQVIFSSTHGYLFFMDASIGFKDNALNSSKRDDAYCVQHYLKTKYPQFGLFYSSILNLLIGYPGEGSEHFFEIFDPISRTLKYQIMKHECKILSLCEVILDKAHPSKDHYFVSSSIDKKVIMWPTAPMSTLVGQTQTKRLLRVADIIDYELRGHSHAIQSLAYAVHNEILFGCGFDFEVIAWDPFSRDVCMKFIGHFKSLASVQIAYIPDEKLLSLDEAGTLKVWNINKDLGIYGNQESSVTVHCSQPAHIKDFVVTHDRGKGVAILAEKVYYLNVETDVLEELKPVQNGFGFCPTAGRVFTIFRSTIHLFDICQSKKIKKISFLDPDRISSTDEIVSHSEEMRMDAPGAANNNNKNNNNETTGKSSSSFRHQPEKEEEEDKNTLKYFNRVDIHDIITAVAMDGHGKKVFLGTRDGRILLFDSYTFGLVKQLTTELEDPAFLHQGSIIGLHYLDRDENLVAAYDNGAVKVYGGCLRAAAFGGGLSGGSDEKRSQSFNSSTVPPLRKSLSRSESISHIAPMKDEPFGSNFNGNFAFYGTSGGKAPTKPSLLRETDIGYILDHSVKALAVSSDHNLVATMTKTGLIFVYDYLTLDFFICLSMEEDIASSTFIEKSLQYLFLEFLPSVPVLLVVDNQNRVSAWGLKGMGNRFLLSWNVYEDIIYNNNKDLNTFYAGFDFQGANPVTMTTPTFFNQLNPQITLIKSFSFMSDAAASSIAVTAAATVVGMGGGTRVSFTAPPPSSSSLGDSLAINTRKKKVIAVENDQRWLIILTTEDGIVLTQNLTPLLERSGAIDHLAKIDGNYPVYTKIKSKRYRVNGLEYPSTEDFPRGKLPDKWENKLLHPVKRSTAAQEIPEIPNAGSMSMSMSMNMSIDMNLSMSGSIILPQAPTRHSSTATIVSQNELNLFKPAKLVKQGTATRKQMRNHQRMMKKMKLDDKITSYVEGLFSWHAFSRIPIRAIQFYNPYLDYSVNEIQQLFNQGPQMQRTTTNIPYECSAQSNRLPLLAVLADNGNIRFWTFTGVYLGQNFEDDIGLINDPLSGAAPTYTLPDDQQRDPNNIEEDLLELVNQKNKSSMFGEIFNLPDLKAATTFVTKLEETEEDPYGSKSNQGKRLLHDEDTSLAPKIYVKSDRTSKLMTKRLSVVAKEYIPPPTANSQNKRPIAFNENTKITNPKLTSTMIIESFINYNNQITSDVNAYEQYSIDHMRLYRKQYGQYGWDFPYISITLPITLTKKDTEYFPIHESTIKYSLIQYKFYLKIISQILIMIQHDINALYLDKIGYFDHPISHHHSSGAPGGGNDGLPARFVSTQAKLYRKISNYATRFQSTENLLKGIDTYLIQSSIQHQKNFQFLLGGKSRPTSGHEQPSSPTMMISKNEEQMQKEMEKKKKEIENLLLYSNVTTFNNLEQSIYDHDYTEAKKNEQLLKYIITGLTDHEIMMANSLQKKNMEKQDKYNLTNLISYIQENNYFSNDLKNRSNSKALHCQHYEKEKFRRQQIATAMGSDDYFIKKLKEMNVDPNELKAMRAKKSKNMNKNNLQNNNNYNQETQGSFEEAGRSMMTITPSASALPVSTVIDVMNTESVDAEQVNIIHSSLQEAMNDLMIPVDTSGIADNGDDDIDQMIDQITKNRRSSAAKTAAAVAPGGSKLPRPNTAPPAFNRKSRSPSPTRTITSPPQTKRKAHSRSPSPSGSPVSTSIIQSSFLASPSQLSQNDLKPTERIMIRPFSANDIFQHTSLPTDQLNSPSLKRKFETTKRLDQIIENLETISITGIQAENSLTYPAVATMDEIIEKSIQQNYATNIRPLSATHESKPHLSMFIDASSTVGGALPTATLQVPSYTSTMEGSDSLPENSRLTKSSSDPGKTEPLQNTIIINTKTIATDPGTIDPANRLLEISQRYEEAILQSKIYSQQFHLYDPLNHKRNVDKEKSNKKFKRKMYLARHRDLYLDEDHQYQSTSSAMQQFITKYYTEDIIDMEKEQKTLEKKRLYIQATAAGEKTTYGFYRVVDIFQFISFTELLTLVDMKDPIVQQILNSEKQSKLFYFNENGLDFSKIVYNQPFYYLQEILEILLDFYNYEENILIKDLLFYRDESPRLPFISLYHLVEIFFSQSKNVSFHLRIFMFISGCTLIYDLFKNAIPPKEFNIKINVKETVTSTTAGDREEEEQEEGNHAIGNNEQMEGTVKVGRKLSISRKSEEALNINVPESRSPFKSASNRAVSPAVTPKSTTTAGRANVITKASSFSSLPEKVSKVKSQLQNNISNDRKLNKKQSGSRLTTAASTAETKPEGSDSEDDDNDEDAESKAEEKKKKELSPPKPLERRASTVRFSQKDETTDVEAAVRTVAEAFNATNRSAIASTTKTSDEGGNTSPGKANAQKRRSNIAIVAMESDHRQRQRSVLIGDLPYQPKEDPNRLVLKVPHNPNIPKGYLLRHTLLLAPLSGKYIVRPHPKRGFRLWLIKRSQFKKISKTLNMWAEGNIECLNVQDFVEIFCSLVPKGDRDNYRIIRNITSSLNRAGIKLIMELNSEILTRILENILEMKIISG